ncbi:MAG: tetratricopeptide repeat protein [Alphaproteobacteria bacterium]|nr:tetratricopeptide repeat protein [Alphaproteobacteria bacterium]
MDRKLTTILVADVVSYSRLMAADEAGTLASLNSQRREINEPKTAHYGGRVVKLMGDGTLMEFGSVVDAVNFAVDVQRSVAAHNELVPEDRRIRYRIGINIGDVLVEGDDIYGDGVNVAARLEGLADPGGICISETVFEHTRNKLDVQVDELFEQEVKNMAQPLRFYRLLLDNQPTDGQRARKPAPPRLEQARGSIAVFPFDSLSPDPNDAYIADGIASEVINMLSRVPDLRVASRSAIFSSRTKGADAWDMVHEHQFRYVLTGNVRHAGNRLRVIAELTEVTSRSQLWSNTYDRDIADVFEVQEEIATAIVTAFGGEFLRAEWQRVSAHPTQNLDAWGLVQKARALNLPVNRNAIDDALVLARGAVAADPSYAGAHACLASVLMQRVVSGFSEDGDADRAGALAAVETAAELAPDDPAVQRTLGKVWSNSGRHDQAVSALRRAVAIAPFDFHSWGRLGRTLCYGGEPEELREGQAILDRILASAPNHPMVNYWLYFKANACLRDDRAEDAARAARKSVEIQPGYAGAWVTLANALGQQGKIAEARGAMDRAQKANPALTPEHLFEQIKIAGGGDEAHAEKALAGLKAAGLL